MCGISVIVALQGPVDPVRQNAKTDSTAVNHDGSRSSSMNAKIKKELDESLDRIAHRGPDARGQWISPDNRIALGHARLAINDLSPDGEQPFHDPENTVHAVVNGELYDHDRIRQELIDTTGYKFRGHSDCEIVVALYKIHGTSFLSHLRGEFALCLYDSKTKFFLAARDRYGIKPLFWTIANGRLLIAAEAKAFLLLGWKPEWDVKSLMDLGWDNDERTVFLNVNKVRPGHYLTCLSSGHIETSQYWDIEYPDKRAIETRTEAEMIAGLRAHMLEAVRLRLRADVPVGIYLSGGIDSSAIAGMVTHLVNEQGARAGNAKERERVSCFGIAFDEESGMDESAIASRTAEHLDVKFFKKHMNEAALARDFEDATYHCEHHNMDLNYVGKYALSQVPRENGYKVVITGEGADENFAGYILYLPDFLREPDPSWPSSQLSEEDRIAQLHQTEEACVQMYASMGTDSSNRKPCTASRQLNNITTCSSLAAFQPPIWSAWTKEAYGECDPRLTIANNSSERVRAKMIHSWHPLHSAQYVWQKAHLANMLLSCLGDRTEMAHSVEARTPFLDHHLTEYANRLPPSLKIRWDPKSKQFTEKWILREAAKPFITKELYKRKKHPYTAPAMWPEGGEIHQLMQRLISKENVEGLGFVDWEQAKDLVHNAFVQKQLPAFRNSMFLAQWVVLSQKFGVKKAEPPTVLMTEH